MKHSFSLLEGLLTLAGMVVLLLVAAVPALPPEQVRAFMEGMGAASLLEPATLFAVETGAILVFLLALLLGMRRHRDAAPFFFGTLGMAMLLYAPRSADAQLLAPLCGLGILIAGAWNAAARTVPGAPSPALPVFSDMLNRSLPASPAHDAH